MKEKIGMNIRKGIKDWVQGIRLRTKVPELVKGVILLAALITVFVMMKLNVEEISAADTWILIGLAVAAVALYFIEIPLHWSLKILIWLGIPILCFLSFETLTHSMDTMIKDAYWLNVGFYYWIYLVLFLLTGRLSLSSVIATGTFFVIGIVNYYILQFRGLPLVPWDIFSIGTAAEVADNYEITVDVDLAKHIYWFILLLLAGSKTKLRLKMPVVRIGAIAALCVPAYFFISYLWQPDLKWNSNLNMTTFNAKTMQSKDGFFVTQIIDLNFVKIEKPQGYSEEKALALLAEQEPDDTPLPEVLPNIIVIMSETFSDPAVLGEINTNKDYMPFTHRILAGEIENTISGYTYVSVLGGNTANSEFEFLSGNSMAFFPNGSVPYLQYIRKGLSTMVQQFNEWGYTTYGYHPYRPRGWNRSTLYPLFGFDYSIFQEESPYRTKLRNYISDRSDFKSVLKWYRESRDPVFIFNVTMQNHSNYGGDYANFDPEIKASFPRNASSKYLNKYLSLMLYSDRDMEWLLGELEKSDEPTIVVFFGDHQPNDYVVKPIYKNAGIDFDNQTLDQEQARRMTPFFLWANYDIGETRTDVVINPNYLDLLLFETAGLPMNAWQTFRYKLWKGDLPFLNMLGIKDAEGNFIEMRDADEKTKQILLDYQTIQYYRMKGEYKN